jgi:hypothetical protein
VLEKVRPIVHRENGSDPQPETGLAKDRLALVHRYMVDAQQAEASRRDAEEQEARSHEAAPAAAAGEQGAGEAADRMRRLREREQRRAERLVAEAGTKREAAPPAAEETLERVPATRLTDVPSGGTVEEAAKGNGQPDPREEAQARKTLAKADERAAKQAARQIAALEKKESRERKALAKAAARRKTA